MPILILSGGDAAPVSGRHVARALIGAVVVEAGPVTGRHAARGGYLGFVSGRHFAFLAAQELVQARHLAYARQDTPVEVIVGTLPVTATVTTNAGQPLSVEYTDDGTGPTMTVTAFTRPGGSALTAQFSFSGPSGKAGREGGPLEALPPTSLQGYEVRSSSRAVTLDLDDQYQRDDGTGVYTLRGYSKAAVRLNSLKLPELVSFALAPTPRPKPTTPCNERPKPQRAFVSGVVAQALQAAGVTLSFERAGDPLAGQEWVEWEKPYSTKGKTPAQVLEDTYYAVGWQGSLQLIGSNAVLYLYPPGGSLGDMSVNNDTTIRGGSTARVSAQFPAVVDVQGVDVKDDLPDLKALVGGAPDPAAYDREVQREAQWYENTSAPDGGEIVTSYFKTLGRITATSRVTRQDVTVQEAVDGESTSRTFTGVLTGWETTDLAFSPACPDMLLRQRTVKRSWGYGVGTELTTVNVSAIAYYAALPAGDPLDTETEVIEQTWNPEGWLQSRVTKTRKVTSVKQDNAEGAPDERGPMQAHEFVDRILSERWYPEGTGWVREWEESGGQPVPLFDAESLDAVRLAYRATTLTSGREKLDSAPPMTKCVDVCAKRKRAVPNILRLTAQEGRSGTEVQRSITFTDKRDLLRWAALNHMALLAPRDEVRRTFMGVPNIRAGTRALNGGSNLGIAQDVNISASGGSLTTSVTFHQRALVSAEETVKVPEAPYRDLVIYRQPGGVTVQHFTGRFDGGGKPEFRDVFVRVSGGQYPALLDELEWVDDPRYGPTATGNYGQDALGG